MIAGLRENLSTATAQLSEKSREVEELNGKARLLQQSFDTRDRDVKFYQSRLAKAEEAIRSAMDNLGVPQPGYLAPVSVAYEILEKALSTLPKPPETEGARGWLAYPNNEVACVSCKEPVKVTAMNAIRCESCKKEAKGGSEEELKKGLINVLQHKPASDIPIDDDIVDLVERTIIPAKDPDEGLDEELRLLRELEKRLREFAAKQSYPKILEIEDICGKLSALRAGDEGGKCGCGPGMACPRCPKG